MEEKNGQTSQKSIGQIIQENFEISTDLTSYFLGYEIDGEDFCYEVKTKEIEIEDIVSLIRNIGKNDSNPFIEIIMLHKLDYFIHNYYHFKEIGLEKSILEIYFGFINITHALKTTDLEGSFAKFDENLYNAIIADDKENINSIVKKIINIRTKSFSSESKYNLKICNMAYGVLVGQILGLSFSELATYYALEFSTEYDTFHDLEDILNENFEMAETDKAIYRVIVDHLLEDPIENKDIINNLIKNFENSSVEVSSFRETKNQKQTNDKKIIKPSNKIIFTNYKEINETLKNKIIGQEKQIDEIINKMKIQNYLPKDKGAKGVFLLVGPTGVGKTEVTNLIAKEFGYNLIRIDMSEYKEKHELSKIIGSAPGLVGYDEKNSIFDKIHKTKNPIILIDELEKAHPEILDIFLQIFDSGIAKTSQNIDVDFSDIFFFITSNIGTSELNYKNIGFNERTIIEEKKVVSLALARDLRPEFINRIDKTIYFNSLKKEDAIKIIDLVISNIIKKLNDEKNIKVNINHGQDYYDYILKSSNFEKYGAREIRRKVEESLLLKIIEYILENDFTEIECEVKIENNQLFTYFEKPKTKKKDIQ